MNIQTNNDLPDDRSSLPGSILEHIADAVVSAGKRGTIRCWNRAATELFDQKRDIVQNAITQCQRCGFHASILENAHDQPRKVQ